MAPRKGRKQVRSQRAVKDLSRMLGDMDHVTDKINDKFSGLFDIIQNINDELSTSKKSTKENVDQANLQANVAKKVLDHIQNENSASKIGMKFLEAKYKIMKKLGFITKDEYVESMFTAANTIKDTSKKGADLSKHMEDITTELKSQIPYGSEIAKLFKKKGKAAAKFLAVLTIIGGTLQEFAKRVQEIGQAFGAIGVLKFKDQLLASNREALRLGKSFSDVSGIVDVLTKEYGLGFGEAIDLTTNKILDTSTALGISSSEAANLFGTLVKIGGLSTEAADNFAKQAASMALANNVAPQNVISDIAKSSETIAKFWKGTGVNIQMASIFAQRLGTDMDTLGKAAEGVLDFQSSLQKEVEASVLIGKNLNLQKARELALEKDLIGFGKELVKQLGSREAFGNLNILQQQALADVFQIQVDQLAKFTNNQQQALSIGQKMARHLGIEKLVGKEALDSVTQLVNNLKVIGAVMVDTVGPALSMVTGLLAKMASLVKENELALRSVVGLVTGIATSKFFTTLGTLLTILPMGRGIGLGAKAIAGVAGVGTGLYTAATAPTAHDGGFTTRDGLVNTQAGELIIPDEKLGNVIKSALTPLVAEIRNTQNNMANMEVTTRISGKDLELVLTPTKAGGRGFIS